MYLIGQLETIMLMKNRPLKLHTYNHEAYKGKYSVKHH